MLATSKHSLYQLRGIFIMQQTNPIQNISRCWRRSWVDVNKYMISTFVSNKQVVTYVGNNAELVVSCRHNCSSQAEDGWTFYQNWVAWQGKRFCLGWLAVDARLEGIIGSVVNFWICDPRFDPDLCVFRRMGIKPWPHVERTTLLSHQRTFSTQKNR